VETLFACNLCGSSRFSLFADKRGQRSKHTFRIVRCDDCGLMFVSPRLSAEESRALYEEAHAHADHPPTSVGDDNAGTLEKIAALKPGRSLRLLDIGCGSGGLLRALKGAGYDDVWGVELSPHAADIAKQTPGVKVVLGDIVDVSLPGGSFDVINATDVLEHLRDPLSTFRRIKSLLAPGGVFLYGAGNAHGLYARVLGARWPHLHPEWHLFYYSPEALTRYFLAVGLDPVPLESLSDDARRAYLAAEDKMARAMLKHVGKSDRGVKGRIFSLVGGIESGLMQRAVTRVVGKHLLPIAINRGLSLMDVNQG
jgi:SAM-dependent methyltransferase